MAIHFEGRCPASGRCVRLERTPRAEAAARRWMAALPRTGEGKMLGLLIGTTPGGQERILYAYSGLGPAPSEQDWAPPLPSGPPLARAALDQLDALKERLLASAQEPIWAELGRAEAIWERVQAEQRAQRARSRAERDLARLRAADEAALIRESQHQGAQWRRQRRHHLESLQPLRQRAQQLRDQQLEWKRQRRELSRGLQQALHRQFDQGLFEGQPWSLASLFPSGAPTGVGECAAPKLIVQARQLDLAIEGLAEFWWGPEGEGRQPGQFYPACPERCQPLLAALLAPRQRLEIVWDDEALVVVNKPSGVLSVPGRGEGKHDSVLTRLRQELWPVHRLDLETSGLLVLARSPEIQRQLHRQFSQRGVEKVYQALLCDAWDGPSEGLVELPLVRDHDSPSGQPRYRPDPHGKPSSTAFRHLGGERMELRPLTGRSHQLRVHAAFGWNNPIQGDPIYTASSPADRLMLHAWRLRLEHPCKAQTLRLEAPLPF